MGASPYPLPRSARQSDVLAGDGVSATYGPFSFKIADEADVTVWTKASGQQQFAETAVTVAKLAGLKFDNFKITFASALPLTTQFIVSGVRIANRDVAISNGGTLDALQLEAELSRLSITQQELRRDIDAAVRPDKDQPGFTILPGAAGQIVGYDNDPSVLKPVVVTPSGVQTPFMAGLAASADTALECRILLGSNFVLKPEHFGGVGNGVHDDTAAWQAMFAAAMADAMPMLVTGGTWLIEPGQVKWKLTGNGGDIAGPQLFTAGKVTLTTDSGSAGLSFLDFSNDETVTAGATSFIDGGFVGPLWFADPTGDTAPNRHGVTMHGVRGIRFAGLFSRALRGNLLHWTKAGTTANADRFGVTGCQFEFVSAETIQGWALMNDAVSQVGAFNRIGFLRNASSEKGALYGHGSGNSFERVSVAYCKGWAIDLQTDSTVNSRDMIGAVELDACEYGIRADGLQLGRIGPVRVAHKYHAFTAQNGDAVAWPKAALSLGGAGAGSATTDIDVTMIHRFDGDSGAGTGITAANQAAVIGAFTDFNSDASVQRVAINHILGQISGGGSVARSKFAANFNANSRGVLIKADGVVIFDNLRERGVSARASAGIAIGTTGYGTEAAKVILPSEEDDDLNAYDTATGLWLANFTGSCDVAAALTAGTLAAGSTVKLALMKKLVSTGVVSFVTEAEYVKVHATARERFTVSATSIDVIDGETQLFFAAVGSVGFTTEAGSAGHSQAAQFSVMPRDIR